MSAEKNIRKIVKEYRHPIKLNHNNHVSIWPFCDHRPSLDDPRGSLFSLSEGWKLVGWRENAPFNSSREYNQCIVLEKTTPEKEDGFGTFDHLDFGIYWIHCKLNSMNFLVK